MFFYVYINYYELFSPSKEQIITISSSHHRQPASYTYHYICIFCCKVTGSSSPCIYQSNIKIIISWIYIPPHTCSDHWYLIFIDEFRQFFASTCKPNTLSNNNNRSLCLFQRSNHITNLIFSTFCFYFLFWHKMFKLIGIYLCFLNIHRYIKPNRPWVTTFRLI